MNKRYRLGEIEEAVSEMEELIGLEDDIAEIDDDFQIVVSGWSVYAETLNLTLRQGIACVWDAEEGLFMPDFDVTIVYEGNIETQEWLYYEQDGMVVTLGNWLNGRAKRKSLYQCLLIRQSRWTSRASQSTRMSAIRSQRISGKNSIMRLSRNMRKQRIRATKGRGRVQRNIMAIPIKRRIKRLHPFDN